jgi:hypothetical protein
MNSLIWVILVAGKSEERLKAESGIYKLKAERQTLNRNHAVEFRWVADEAK